MIRRNTQSPVFPLRRPSIDMQSNTPVDQPICSRLSATTSVTT